MRNLNPTLAVQRHEDAADSACTNAQGDVVVTAAAYFPAEVPSDWKKIGEDIAARYPVTLAELAK